MTSVFIEPCDIVFFRDDLPFGAGGSQFGRCQFPPRPSVIAGALRTKVLASQGIDFDAFRTGGEIAEAVRREIGHGTMSGGRLALAEGTFRLVGLHLGRRGDGGDVAFHRVGRDLVVGRGKGAMASTASRLVSPSAAHRVQGASSLGGLVPLAIVPGAEPANGWLATSDYEDYLAGHAPASPVIRTTDVLAWDDRVGIGLDSASRTANEGQLFSSRGAVLREGWGFVADVDGCSLLPDSGLIRLGGDGRMARLSAWSAPPVDGAAIRAAVARSRRFRLVLQTPGIFTGGWRPGLLREEDGDLVLDRDAYRARLVAAAVGAPELAGGWDLVRCGPKPFRLTAPAGTVFWFEVAGGDAEAVWNDLNGHSISDERANEGFGLVHVGGWAHV